MGNLYAYRPTRCRQRTDPRIRAIGFRTCHELHQDFPGWTSKSYDGLKEGRRVQLDNKDMDATSHYFPNHVIKAGATVWQGGVNLSFGQEYVSLNLSGVYPNHTEVEVVKLFEGRFINEIDIKERRKVIVLHKKTAEILLTRLIPSQSDSLSTPEMWFIR